MLDINIIRQHPEEIISMLRNRQLASEEPCSQPDRLALRALPRHRPARPGGAMFPRHSPSCDTGRGDRRAAATSGEHRSTQASCVVAGRMGGQRLWC